MTRGGYKDQSEEVLDRVRHSEQKLLQSSSVLSADQAVEHRVEAAVCMSQAHSQGEGVGLCVVEGFTEGHHGKSLVGQPADEKGQNYDGDGAGELGPTAVASPLAL
ncbi:hypothetical protein INR49_010538 [Caranx melampygus]|nr:hypothetical protein INR49_010538 [Caranx melampygus]